MSREHLLTNIVLLDDLLESSIVQLRELGQVMYISNYIAQIFLQKHKVLLGRRIDVVLSRILIRASQLVDDIVYLLVGRGDPTRNVIAPDMLKCEDFVELVLELVDESLLVVFVPWSSRWVWVLCCGRSLEGRLKIRLQVVVGYV